MMSRHLRLTMGPGSVLYSGRGLALPESSLYSLSTLLRPVDLRDADDAERGRPPGDRWSLELVVLLRGGHGRWADARTLRSSVSRVHRQRGDAIACAAYWFWPLEFMSAISTEMLGTFDFPMVAAVCVCVRASARACAGGVAERARAR